MRSLGTIVMLRWAGTSPFATSNPSMALTAWAGRPAVAASTRTSTCMCSTSTGSTTSASDMPSNGPGQQRCKDRARRDRVEVGGQTLELMTAGDRACIEERQLQHKVAPAAVGARCRYGFPQAFVFHPVKHNVSSGLSRLTCPMLVQAIDTWERENAIAEFNARLAKDSSWREAYAQANAAVASVRKDLVDSFEGGHDKIRAILSADATHRLLNSGIAGVTPTLLDDVKCLHAQLADHLCRGGTTFTDSGDETICSAASGGNMIGAAVLDGLQERGVHVSGCDSCWQQCDARHERTPDSWFYTPLKNKQRLRLQKERRQKLKHNVQRKAAAAAAALAHDALGVATEVT